MNILHASFLGLVQGLTEFLPISSSAHLAVFQFLLPGFNQPGILFDVILHLATTLAVVLFFWKDIFSYYRKYFIQTILASIPAAFLGYLFSDFFEGLFRNLFAVGLALIVTGALNFSTDIFKFADKKLDNSKAFLIGIAQAIAIAPGISRSGATIFAGSCLGINKSEAAKFSFLISVPAILGANLLQVIKHRQSLESINVISYVIGFLMACIIGYLSIKIVFIFLKEGRFKYFAYYAFIAGLILILI